VKPAELLELNALEGIVELVRSGLGVAVVPLLRDARWATDGKLRVIEIPQVEERRMALVQRRDSAKGQVVASVVREFQAKLPA
jgi:DNA-binding transcriptional LysR family regulator